MSMRGSGAYRLPTPYPDELWYSVISRYHRHSGNIKSLTTKRELFGTTNVTWNPLSVEGVVVSFLTDVNDVIQKHTVEPYVLRYYSAERKQEIRDTLMCGERIINRPSVRTKELASMRYCPQCSAEDESKYGELYWHREHQIPEMPCCPKHGCILEDSEVELKVCTYHFCAADRMNCPSKTPRYEVTEAVRLYARYLYACLDYPLSFSEKTSTLSLRDAMLRDNVIRLAKNGFVCKSDELYTGLRETFGTELVADLYTKESLTRNIRRTLFGGSFFSAGHIMLLAAYYRIPYDKLLSCEKDDPEQNSVLEERIRKVREMSQQGYCWSLQLAAKHIGVSSDVFRKIVKLAGVEPFWDTSHVGKGNHVVSQIAVKMYVTEAERECIRRRAEELGMPSTAEYLRYCVQRDLNL